jgi:YgiT-type zinc finger domain-containing protein
MGIDQPCRGGFRRAIEKGSKMNESPSLPVHESVPCGECAAGVIRLRHITYFTWLGDELITVPNFPAWICDMCGKCEYDERAISWLTMLLNPNAGKPTHRVRRRPRSGPPKRNISHPPLD